MPTSLSSPWDMLLNPKQPLAPLTPLPPSSLYLKGPQHIWAAGEFPLILEDPALPSLLLLLLPALLV